MARAKEPPTRRAHTEAKRRKKAPKVRKDPLREYTEAMKRQGAETVGLLDETCASNVKAWVSTGSLALDTLLGGGVACGRLVEIYGPQHIGKSTVLDQLFKQVQAQGGFGVLIDTEAARDRTYTVSGLGVDADKLTLLQFKDPMDCTIENIADKILSSVDFWREQFPDVPVVLGWDSLGNTTTAEEMVKPVGERNVASAAKAMRDLMRKLMQRLARSTVALIIVNHQYTAINTARGGRPASRATYAGDALRLAATMRIELFYKGLLKRADGQVLGREVGCRLDKNKLGWCGETSLAVLTGRGIDNSWTLFRELGDAGYIQRDGAGAWATLEIPGQEPVRVQGWMGLAQRCAEDPTLFATLVGLYRQHNRPPGP